MLIELKQTVKTPIRRRIVRRLVWVSTVCICPAKRTLGLNWLMFECSSASIFCEGELQRFSRACAFVQIRLISDAGIRSCIHITMVQQRLRRICTNAQARENLCNSPSQNMDADGP